MRPAKSNTEAGRSGTAPTDAVQVSAGNGSSRPLDLNEVAAKLGVPYLEDVSECVPSVEFVERIPIAFARHHLVLGLASNDDTLPVLLGAVEGWGALDVLYRFLGRRVEPVFAPASAVRGAINSAYEKRTGQTQRVIESLEEDGDVLDEIRRLPQREDLLDARDRAPIIKLVNMMLFEAVTGLASDVHIQPYEDRLVVRLRIDGVLFDAYDVPKPVQEEVVSRIKVLGRMNVAEKRLPQDGRATVEVGDRMVDLRIASMPTSHGERVVIRLLDKSARLYTLGELGMSDATLAQFRKLIRLDHGMILVTGPTGSGKSTTLYAALREIDVGRLNVITLEDPIEYQLDGISQTQINTKKGMTFASGLRSVLRQDPDIIMVGEIRDEETAVMAIQAALTGHLVLSTLHTNDAASAVTRLLDLGIEPYLVASSVVGILAQRLVRRICPKCSTVYAPTAEELKEFNRLSIDLNGLKKGVGCAHCRQTGFRGRFGISELLVVDEDIREQIQQRANAAQILTIAQRSGMERMRDDGIDKICAGLTTWEEVSRVTAHAAE